jgi:hypothetical protein
VIVSLGCSSWGKGERHSQSWGISRRSPSRGEGHGQGFHHAPDSAVGHHSPYLPMGHKRGLGPLCSGILTHMESDKHIQGTFYNWNRLVSPISLWWKTSKAMWLEGTMKLKERERDQCSVSSWPGSWCRRRMQFHNVFLDHLDKTGYEQPTISL